MRDQEDSKAPRALLEFKEAQEPLEYLEALDRKA